MRVLLLSTGPDTAGQLWALQHAIASQRPSWSAVQMRRKDNYIHYPTQRPFDEGVIRATWRRADVVHLNQTLRAFGRFDAGRRVPLLIHHHGTEYRAAGPAIDAACRAACAAQAASTLDLLGSAGVEWLPTVADLDAIAALRPAVRRSGPIRIAHSPTNRSLKGTDAVIAAVAQLRTRGVAVELDLIERATWRDCLTRKAQADIFIDQFWLGYGLSAIEAWAMGIPVIAGTSIPAARERMVATFGDLPFWEASVASLTEQLAVLVESASLRAEWGERGRAHAQRFHGEAAVVARLEPIYERAISLRKGSR